MTTKVRVKTTYAGPHGAARPGQLIELPDEDAAGLIDAGYAEAYVEPPADAEPAGDAAAAGDETTSTDGAPETTSARTSARSAPTARPKPKGGTSISRTRPADKPKADGEPNAGDLLG